MVWLPPSPLRQRLPSNGAGVQHTLLPTRLGRAPCTCALPVTAAPVPACVLGWACLAPSGTRLAVSGEKADVTPPGQACGSPGSKGVGLSAHPPQEKFLLPEV